MDILGDLQKTVSFNMFLRREAYGGFDGSSWKISGPIDEIVYLGDSNGRRQYSIFGLTTDTPKLRTLDQKGMTRSDCAPVLAKAASPTIRYEKVLDLLKTPQPRPEVAIKVYPAVYDLPPTELLFQPSPGTGLHLWKQVG